MFKKLKILKSKIKVVNRLNSLQNISKPKINSKMYNQNSIMNRPKPFQQNSGMIGNMNN